jgi:hypothetical protein
MHFCKNKSIGPSKNDKIEKIEKETGRYYV